MWFNNCGELVFFRGLPADLDSEIFWYDNGELTQVTNNQIADSIADINDSGAVSWTEGIDGNGNGQILKLENEMISLHGVGGGPVINGAGHIAWSHPEPKTCAFESSILFFDGQAVAPITIDEWSNQGVKLNDMDQMVWTSYDFCDEPFWTSETKFYSNGVITTLPSTQDYPQAPDINNLGHAAWSDFDFIELWNGEETVVFTEGHIPALNDLGDMAFRRASPTRWQVWVYLNGEFYRLTDTVPPLESGRADINNNGEVVWRWVHSSQLSPGGIRFMRRIRNGDVNHDDSIDLNDFQSFPQCITGPGDFDRLCSCRFNDMEHDRDVDMNDFSLFQNTFANVQYPGHGCCEVHADPAGCNDRDIEQCICTVLPQCCQTAWDEYCVHLVEVLGCGSCE